MNLSGKEAEIGDIWEVHDANGSHVSTFLILGFLEEFDGTIAAVVWVMYSPRGPAVVKSQLPQPKGIVYVLVARL